MLQTLFYIPHEYQGIPILGWGILLWLWLLVAGIVLALWYKQSGGNWDWLNAVCFSAVIAAVIGWGLPRLAEEQGIPIRGYGVLMLAAVISGVGLALHRARQVGLPGEAIYSLAVWLVVGGILGARLFYVIEYWEQQFYHTTVDGRFDWQATLFAVLSIQKGGLVVFGSLIGALLGLFAFTRYYRLPLLPLADLIAPSMAVGQAVGRIGCFFNGCCYGSECDLPWAVQFPWGSPPHIRQIEQGKIHPHGIQLSWNDDQPATVIRVDPDSPASRAGLKPGQTIRRIAIKQQPAATEWTSYPQSSPEVPNPQLSGGAALTTLLKASEPGTTVQLILDSQLQPLLLTVTETVPRARPIHPTQIYSALDAFLLAGVLWLFWPLRTHDGQVLALTLILHSVSRFLLEIIRIDESSVFGTGLSISQNISLGMFVCGAVLWWYVSRRERFRVTRSHGVGVGLV